MLAKVRTKDGLSDCLNIHLQKNTLLQNYKDYMVCVLAYGEDTIS